MRIGLSSLIKPAALLFCALLAGGTFLSGQALAAGNTWNDKLTRTKRTLERQVYKDHRETLYCGYSYDERKAIDLPAGFYTPKHEKRALRVEWEHTVPVENFGRFMPEWRDGDPRCVRNGRPYKGWDCAELLNSQFRYMISDMYNLYPAVGAVNALRGHKPYAELPSMRPTFGQCAMKIDVRGNRAEPPARAKGKVARAALYMEDAYAGHYRLSDQQRQLFEAWDHMFPVDKWECTRTRRIEKIQGNENKFVKVPCKKLGLW